MLRSKFYAKELAVAVVIGLLMYCASILSTANNSTYQYAIELWNYGEQVLNILYPIISTIPFCWILFHEKNDAYWKSVFNRTSLNKYILKRVLIAILLSAIAMFIVSFGSLFFAYLIAPINASIYETTAATSFYGMYQLSHPVIYAFVLSCWRSILSALYTLFGVGITMISKNVFVAMTGTFVYSIAENFITAILQIPEFSICTSFYPNRLSAAVITFPKLIVGPLTLAFATALIYVFFFLKIRRKLMD
jgi:hypothetical protein